MTPKLLTIDGAKAAKKPGEGRFPDGEKVEIKSGGPIMVVESSGPEWTTVSWFDDVGQDIGPRQFKNAALKKHEPPKPKRKPAPVSRRRARAK